MSLLTANQPLSTTTPLLLVENKLAAGTFVFSLTVVDNSGNVSAPAQLRVTVAAPSSPPSSPPPPAGPGTPRLAPAVTRSPAVTTSKKAPRTRRSPGTPTSGGKK
jgi:hypothetical protein